MRIAVVTARTDHGGIDRATDRLRAMAEGLQAAGHDVQVVCPRWWPQGSSMAYDRRLTYRAGGTSNLTRRGVWRHVRAIDPDVVHLVDVRPSIATAARVAVRGGAIVYEPMDYSPPIQPSKWSPGVRGIDRMIVPSRTVQTAMRTRGFTIPMPVVPDPISFGLIERTVGTDRADIVWAGESSRRSDLEIVLLGLAELRSHNWRAAIIDPPGGVADLRLETQELDIADRVEIIDHATERERIAMYRHADAFVQTSDDCAYPTELVRAMAAGCVGIVQYRERSAAHEIIEAHRHGELISSPEELADAIVAAADREVTTVDDAFARYDRATVVDNTLEVYQESLNRTV